MKTCKRKIFGLLSVLLIASPTFATNFYAGDSMNGHAQLASAILKSEITKHDQFDQFDNFDQFEQLEQQGQLGQKFFGKRGKGWRDQNCGLRDSFRTYRHDDDDDDDDDDDGGCYY